MATLHKFIDFYNNMLMKGKKQGLKAKICRKNANFGKITLNFY